MKVLLQVLLLMVPVSMTQAQSLPVLKQTYDQVSPLTAPSIKTTQVLEADKSYSTPLEEQLSDLKEQQAEAQKAQTEKVYLDTDYQFFQALAVPEEYDELDEATKKDQLAAAIEQNARTQKTVGSEIKTVTPKLMSLRQGAAVDQRRTLILKKIAKNGKIIRACILQNRKPETEFKGTHMTLSWEVVPSGKVENAEMKVTDVESKEINDCVLKALAAWDFSDILKSGNKRSRIEYTYRFVNPTPPTASLPASTQAQN